MQEQVSKNISIVCKAVLKNALVKTLFAVILITSIAACSEDPGEIEYAAGYPSKLAGNWVVFQFHGGDLDGPLTGPYDIVTALDANRPGYLIVDNIYNSGVRARAEILGDTGIVANKVEQLELINKGGYGIETVSIDGYIQENSILANFLYSLAAASFENIAFTADDITEIIFFRAGLYDELDAPVDTIMIMGYRKTGFEDVDYND